MTTQTELEKTQLEIAKLQLEQEKHKLAQMQKRQKVVDDLGQGAVAVGGAAVKGGSAVVRWAGRWIGYAVVLELLVIAVASIFIFKSLPPNGEFGWALGHFLGSVHAVNIITVIVCATIATALPPETEKSAHISGVVVLGVLVVLVAGYFNS